MSEFPNLYPDLDLESICTKFGIPAKKDNEIYYNKTPGGVMYQMKKTTERVKIIKENLNMNNMMGKPYPCSHKGMEIKAILKSADFLIIRDIIIILYTMPNSDALHHGMCAVQKGSWDKFVSILESWQTSDRELLGVDNSYPAY